MKWWQKNACDGMYHSLDVHFTNICYNKCSFCINQGSTNINSGVPNWRKMLDTVVEQQANFEDVLILGGEPCLFLADLLMFVRGIKDKTSLRVYCTSSIPKTCYDNQAEFYELLGLLDGFNISAQHYIEGKADNIRRCKSQYNRQAFYAKLPYKDKIRVNLNLVKGVLESKEDVSECVKHYDGMGFYEIRLTELQHAADDYVSFENIYRIRLSAPYFSGCQTFIDSFYTMGFMTQASIILKRSCFVCEYSKKASFLDFAKFIYKIVMYPGKHLKGKYGILYEDGRITSDWLKGGDDND